MNISRIKRKLTPGFIRKRQRERRDQSVQREFFGLTAKEVFEKIYDEKYWGDSIGNRQFSSGDGTRDESIVDIYVKSITQYISSRDNLKTALDLGCGDFSVGSKLSYLFDHYTAIDVAENVIEENRKLFKARNVKFKSLNITEDELPHADVVFVRQVLQHLSNKEIQKFLVNVQDRYKCLVITESLSKSIFFSPNKDMQSGPGIRIHNKSGVVIEAEPFNFQSSQSEVILEYRKGRELLRTTVYYA